MRTGTFLCMALLSASVMVAASAAAESKIQVFYHDEDEANRVASEFFRVVAVRDFEKAYSMVDPLVQNQLPFTRFVEIWQTSLQKLGAIESVIWDSFYPQLGQPLIGLHYVVHHAQFGETDYYFLLHRMGKTYRMQYWINGPRGQTMPKMMLQIRRPVKPREVLRNE